MKFTIDIDNGGTFTDAFFTGEGRIEWVKVDTTPHDLTICFLKCIEEGANRFGLTMQQMLRGTEVIRFSTTKATNTLITKTGPKLGLIVTRGADKSLYRQNTENCESLKAIIPDEMAEAIDEQAGKDNVNAEQVRTAIRNLLGRGARIIVVSLEQAHSTPGNEQKVKQIADEDYPKHYLGAVPVLLSTEVSLTPDDSARTNIALLNAYFHPDMVRFLYKAEDQVRNMGYRNPLLVVHADGGAARVAKTTAIMTYGSGPAAGVLGTSFMSKIYSLPMVASIDIGGTSTDVSLVIDGKHSYKREALLDGIPVTLPTIEVFSLAAGGGSVAHASDKGLKVGPDSAGAMPGPACFGLGGLDATSSDAAVVLGYLDPEYFLGGKRKLDADKARESIENNVAKSLSLPVEKCAKLITEDIEAIGANGIKRLIAESGSKPSDFVLFSFGGAGGLYCSGIADKAGISRIYVFRFSSVFCAFGSSCADVLHSYETLAKISISKEAGKTQIAEFNSVVKYMMDAALRNMRGEGFLPEQVSLTLELEALCEDTPVIVQSPVIQLESQVDADKILDSLTIQNSVSTATELLVTMFRLRATSPVAHPAFPSYEFTGKNPEKALKGFREVYWKDLFSRTAIYQQEKLECGNEILGPAIIESVDTTILLPAGKKYSVDNFLNGVIDRN
ncbi:hydantoinase/oxoprolinase family protein [Chloroflexota bacterium]